MRFVHSRDEDLEVFSWSFLDTFFTTFVVPVASSSSFYGVIAWSDARSSSSTWISVRGREILHFGIGVTLGLVRISVIRSLYDIHGFKMV